jgi:hypothetical protein
MATNETLERCIRFYPEPYYFNLIKGKVFTSRKKTAQVALEIIKIYFDTQSPDEIKRLLNAANVARNQ